MLRRRRLTSSGKEAGKLQVGRSVAANASEPPSSWHSTQTLTGAVLSQRRTWRAATTSRKAANLMPKAREKTRPKLHSARDPEACSVHSWS